MQLQTIEMIFVFTIFSIAGWFLEFVFRSLKAGRLVNPGLLRGPYLPIYGFGAVILNLVNVQIPPRPFFLTFITILSYFPDPDRFIFLKPLLTTVHLTTKAMLYFIAATSLEFFAGWSLNHFFNVRLWDYRGQRWTIRGYVCLGFSFCWVILAFALEYFLLPSSMIVYRHFTLPMAIFSILLLEIIMIDFLLKAEQLLSAMEGKRRKEALMNEREFLHIIEPLLSDPLVGSLEKYRHHYQKNRLEHCLDVAWHSYRIALENARKVMPLTKKEENIILRHMWPLTVIPPVYPEAWIVSMVDKYCCTKDYFFGIAATCRRAFHTGRAHFLH